ncbi:MAG: molybdopterin-guanine dinucleotide biosynthesis protein B [Bryobacterales bacterium]|nr:molybdopterin-guanine dinucleotide biosynthesis protein B [Bryobacterales bacterium]
MNPGVPAFGVCGWSGSGKTTLLVEVVRRLSARGLRIAVVKDDIHGPDLDREGKDSDRLFRAGADVVLTGPGERFTRTHLSGAPALEQIVKRLDLDHDLVLLEGHKHSRPARRVWLLKDHGDACPLPGRSVLRVLRRDEDRAAAVMPLIDGWLAHRQALAPLCAGILIGGGSRRMGRPKQLLRLGKTTWLERIVRAVKPAVRDLVLLGAGAVPPGLSALPALPDVVNRPGPMAGMLAAMRWRPDASWVFVACDLPLISTAAVEWLLQQRAPGVWAILPRLGRGRAVEPLFALYEFRARTWLEGCHAPSALAGLAVVASPQPPPAIAEAWRNVNTPLAAARLARR